MDKGKRPQGSNAPESVSRPQRARRIKSGQVEPSPSARTDRSGYRRNLLKASLPVAYRYRTAVLIGPWRSDPEQAIDDAVKARQAAYEAGGRFRWLVPGSIESSAFAVDRVETG